MQLCEHLRLWVSFIDARLSKKISWDFEKLSFDVLEIKVLCLLQCLQNPSSDIRLVAEKMIWWANKKQMPSLDPQTIKPILKALLDNTKDKNTSVRAYSDQAIVNLLKMREGEEVLQV